MTQSRQEDDGGTGATFFPLAFFTLDILHKYLTKTNHHVGLVHRDVQSGSSWETENDKDRTQQTGAPPHSFSHLLKLIVLDCPPTPSQIHIF